MKPLIETITEISQSIGAEPSALAIYCEPSIDKDGDIVHLVDIVYNEFIYETLSYNTGEEVVREFKKVNDQFPDLEIHV